MVLIDNGRLNDLTTLFSTIIRRHIDPTAWEWLENKSKLIQSEDGSLQLNLTFSQLSRQTGKKLIQIDATDHEAINRLIPGFSLEDWTIERLSRVWLLMQLDSSDKPAYLKKISQLFSAAEMNELVALYSALPFYAYPEEWIAVCENGIRSNIGTVLESIMIHNPYPAQYLPEPSWNQLVLKAFFTEKNMELITGLHDRVNRPLADTLSDYIRERQAAHRTVHPEIFRLIELTEQKI